LALAVSNLESGFLLRLGLVVSGGLMLEAVREYWSSGL